MLGRLQRLGAIALLLACALTAPRTAFGQQDTADVVVGTQIRADHSPRGALWRASVVPGWGQIYNSQYYKLPIVWGGLLGITGSALYVNRQYLLYRHAYHWIDPRVTYDVPDSYEQDYLTVIRDLGLTPEQAQDRQSRLIDLFRQNRDNLRRNRDLLYIGIGLFYGLTILDAYVSAHLLDFDVSEDLSLSVEPAPGGFAARLHLAP